MDSTSSSMNSSFESISKSPDRQERENRRRQGEIFVFMAKIIGIFMKQYFKNCLMTSMITAITGCNSNIWKSRFNNLYLALKQHRPPNQSEETEMALRRALHVSSRNKSSP